MSDIKTINISGSAANATDVDGTTKKRGRRSVKKKQYGGMDESTSGMNVVKGVESTSSVAASAASPNSNTWLKYPNNALVPPAIHPDALRSTLVEQKGGTKHIKVELKKKHTVKNVRLNPKKVNITKSAESKKNQTKKIRKVTVGISALHKRMTRAKKLHKKMKNMPIGDLKAKLIKGGLIKANSKAPEAVLRQIALDSQLVAGKTL